MINTQFLCKLPIYETLLLHLDIFYRYRGNQFRIYVNKFPKTNNDNYPQSSSDVKMKYDCKLYTYIYTNEILY
jgi:hypothetical protein